VWILLAVILVIPLGLDLYLPVPAANPITSGKIETGRRLFNDRRLSRDGSVACVSCHDPAKAFTDGRPVSIGVFGRVGRRSAPTLINRAYGRAFFWDGRSATLEEQVLKPIENPDEMGLTMTEARTRTGLSADEISRALATYLRSILAGNAPFDRFINGDPSALSPEQQRGLAVFRGKGHCSACHVGPTLTDERFHNTGVAWRERVTGTVSLGDFTDNGRYDVTARDSDRGAFKTPTLREVSRTAPFMHDGSLTTLEEVVDFYHRGGRPNPFLDEDVRPLGLDEAEKKALVAFLHALSGMVTQ
jgi:cytochrome c peroxidase